MALAEETVTAMVAITFTAAADSMHHPTRAATMQCAIQVYQAQNSSGSGSSKSAKRSNNQISIEHSLRALYSCPYNFTTIGSK